ncbi:MAG TPA: hypothetical protein VGZ52_00245, partial [Acidimicrobiales bacterium]|nr:hypothetical protein [Acidimicrobiales bacterium]
MTEVREGSGADVASVSEALVSAFHDDPVMLHIFDKEKGREKKLRGLFVNEAKRSLTKGTLITTSDGPALGGAIWMAPDKWRSGGFELVGQLPLMFTMGLSTPRALGVLGRMEKVHPKQPHWYLAVLGTAAAHQGKGVGS